jgi:nitrous oxide reductase accessory protein NosL
VEIKTQKPRIGVAAALVLSFALVMVLSSCGPSRGAIQSDKAMGYCPVCGMRVNASDPWAAEIYYTDGTKVMFESPGDMLAFYTSPKSYETSDAHKDRASIEKIVVKDYQSKQAIDARQAVFVYKSNINGPMGADFLPFSKRADAEAFVASSGGSIVSLNEVTGDMARDLRK